MTYLIIGLIIVIVIVLLIAFHVHHHKHTHAKKTESFDIGNYMNVFNKSVHGFSNTLQRKLGMQNAGDVKQ